MSDMTDMDTLLRYEMFLEPVPLSRQRQKYDTSVRILSSTLELILESGEEAVTMKAVAARAGVTERTVFRHFESRDVLISSAWGAMQNLMAEKVWPLTAEGLIERPRQLFRRFGNFGGLVRAYLHRTARRNAALRLDEASQQSLVKCVAKDLEGHEEPTLRRRAAIAQVITSAYAWEMMSDAWGFSGEEAGEAAAEAIEVLLGRRLPF